MKQDFNIQSFKDVSIEMKLFLVYYLIIIALLIYSNISPYTELLILLVSGIALISIGYISKTRSDWEWRGLSKSSIPYSILNTVFAYLFLAFLSFFLDPTMPLEFNLYTVQNMLLNSLNQIIKIATTTMWLPLYAGIIAALFMNILKDCNFVDIVNNDKSQ